MPRGWRQTLVTGQGSTGTNWNARSSTWIWGKKLLWGDRAPGGGCSEGFCNLLPWAYSKLLWVSLLWQGGWTGGSPEVTSSPSHSMVVWFGEIKRGTSRGWGFFGHESQQNLNLWISINLLNQLLWHWFKVIIIRYFTVPTIPGCSLKVDLPPGHTSKDCLVQPYPAKGAWMKLPHICNLKTSTMGTLHISGELVPEWCSLSKMWEFGSKKFKAHYLISSGSLSDLFFPVKRTSVLCIANIRIFGVLVWLVFLGLLVGVAAIPCIPHFPPSNRKKVREK